MTRTVYCGVDFHARVQTIAYCDSADGEVFVKELRHRDKEEVRSFYAQFSSKVVVVGLEASGYSRWFERMIEEIGHEVWLGHASDIRRAANRRQKNDRRDAELILDLLIKGEFPRIHRPSNESLEILRMLRYRNQLVKMRTMIKNSLHALAIGSGLSIKSRLLTQLGRSQLLALDMSAAMSEQRQEWLSLVDTLNQRISAVEKWLDEQGRTDARVRLLRTHPGIGPLTSLALVHTLEPVSRFSNARKVVAYIGMEPMERSSGGIKRYLGISKAGSRLVRFLLIEAAHTAVKGDPKLKTFYLRLMHKRGLARAMVAVGRKLLVRSYIMLRDQIDYAEFLSRGIEVRPARENAKPSNA